MQETSQTHTSPHTTSKARWTREAIAGKLAEYHASAGRSDETKSVQAICEELNVPRSTLQYWLARQGNIDEAPEVIAFFESPAGVRFLHRLVLGAQFVMGFQGNCGIRLVCRYLECTGLSQFVAASYGSQQQVSRRIEEQIVAFDQAEKERLGGQMPPKQIALLEDETFHAGRVCLVGIEPRSNFILLEEYAADRSASTWTNSLAKATESLPVDVVLVTSDEAKGICAHVTNELGGHHSPDVFHVQHEVVTGTSLPLAAQVRQAEAVVKQVTEGLRRHQADKAAYEQRRRGPGRPPDFPKRIQQAQAQVAEACAQLETARTRQTRARQAMQGISTAYHPYDVKTGQTRTAEQVSTELHTHMQELETVVQEANLSERCCQKIQKAKRVVTQMVATIAFVVLGIQARVSVLGLRAEMEAAVLTQLIPAFYLERLSTQAQIAETRRLLHQQAEALLAPLLARDGPFSQVEDDDLGVIEEVARDCAHVFQRSSSSVEGRNGSLALRHHHLRQIRPQRLAALTAVHNYVPTRADGTTAAERFFGEKPGDVFEWLLERVDLPGRPAQKRSQPKTQMSLLSGTL